MSLSPTSTAVSSSIRFYGGTVAQIEAQTDLTYISGTTGRTVFRGSYEEGTWIYNGTAIAGWVITGVDGYIVDSGTANTINKNKNTCTHELGHALGWRGHSSNSQDIMYSAISEVTTLTQRDIDHLWQVYH